MRTQTAKKGGPTQPPLLLGTDDENLHWLALRLTPGLGNRKALQLLAAFNTPQAIFRASRSELESTGLPASTAQNVTSGCAFDEAAEQQQKAAQAGVTLVRFTDAHYPALLRGVYDAPPVLFALGRLELLSHVMLGVVGTRRPTVYGTQAASRLAKDLAQSGMTIISGMARGIDTAAHQAVLDIGGETVAVFGCGVDQIYPAENRNLAARIAKEGLVLSEFPMEAPPFPQNFPVRNRIISGMSVGILVVEGSEYSGSAITAKLASQQDREVFAVPGNITSKMSWGPNLLIKQGAKLVQEWNDVVVELEPEIRRRLVDQCRKRLTANELSSIGNDFASDLQSGTSTIAVHQGKSEEGQVSAPSARLSQAVLRALRPDAPTGLDTLVEGVEGCSTSEVLAILFELELSGLVRQLPGKCYVRVWSE